MVASTPTTSHPPVLSYAESAKKAQAVRPTSQHTQKPLSNLPRQPPAPAPISEHKKPGKPSPTVEATQISLADLSLHSASTPGAPGANLPSITSTVDSTSTTRPVDTHDSPPASAVPSLLPSQPTTTKAAPVQNVWNQRIQQRAQARSQPRPPQHLPQTAPSHVPPHVPSPPRDLSSDPSSPRQPDVSASATVQSTLIHSSPPALNGASSSTSGASTGTTPSSRREPLASPHPHPSVEDAENWPEVGKSQVSTAKSLRIGNGHAPLVEAKDGEEKDTDGPSPSHPGTPKKSEKTRWIPIPPEELQAAADALNPPRPYSQSRNHSQFSTRNSQTRSTAASGSGSMQGSQAPSKVASGRTSASHSRAHSPNSMASSPRHPGRGRQLPVDVRGAQAPEQQQRSSQGNSPQAPADVILAAPVPYVQIGRDIYGYSNVPSQAAGAQSYVQPQPPPPPPPHYPPALQVNPNHAQQSYAPSSVSPYPQPYAIHTPTDRYVPAPTQPIPPGWVSPEHYVYPYGYPPYAQPHPILYWSSNVPLDMRPDGRAIYPPYPSVHPHQQVSQAPAALPDGGETAREEESVTHTSLPPPTMIARPPPPQESDAVAGYRAVGPLSDPGSRCEEAMRGRRDVIFGSIGAPEESKSPSPSPPLLPVEDQSGGEKAERVVTTFSIGVAPGEAGPSLARSRTRSQPRLSRAENTADGKGVEAHTATEVKVVDLTDPEIKWEFGTATRAQDGYTQGEESRPEPSESQSRLLGPSAPPRPTLDVSLLFSGPFQDSSLPVAPAEPSPADLQHAYPHPQHHLPFVLPPQIHVPPAPPPQEELQVQPGSGPYPIHQPPPQPPTTSNSDGFEVKNFGYGFGRPGETGHGVTSPRGERLPREWERREADREHYTWRPRGSFSGRHERGGYSGRRGRGTNGFRRAGPGRGFGRGGFQHHHHHQHQNQHQQQQQHHHQQQQQQPQQPQQAPPFTITPPAQAFQSLQPTTPPPGPPTDTGQYLATTIQQQPYMPHGFDAYQAPVSLSYPSPTVGVSSPASAHPVPRPLSNLTFPLEATRFYLLGQLEYYFSVQNLASDLFLRQRMDSRGWIPISLLASFNRVRRLTLDQQLVRDVLALSSIVEIRDDFVRMGAGEWARFVLPDAPVSTVEVESGGGGELLGQDQDRDHAEEDAEVEEEEEEEEIEIVMNREVLGQPWITSSSS